MMRRYSFKSILLVSSFFLVIYLVFLTPDSLFTASTPTNELLKQLGSGAPSSYGDYISSTEGLDTYYRYFIEVPPGTAQLDIQIFDADVGDGGSNDWTNDSYNTSCRYTVYTPGGGTVSQNFTIGDNNGPRRSNNRWRRLYRVNNPAAGHWEVRVDMSSSVTSGNDMNGYGIRARSSDGTELNIYADSFVPLGERNSGETQSTTLYPYITSGCTFDYNDWDGDNGSSTLCTFRTVSRTGNSSTNYNGSGSTIWLNQPISGFTSDDWSVDYGIWSVRATYTDTGARANFGVLYAGSSSASNPPPSSQPESGTFRIYFRTDAGGAPVKPFLTQTLRYVSGPNPPLLGSTTRVRVEIAIINPTPHAITFSSSNVITAYVPGSGAVYAGNAVITSGSILSQPSTGGTGNITWNPGTVSGSNTVETLFYEVDVTPASAGQRIRVTGTPGSNGTTSRYVDETGNSSQSRARYTFGPLCELAATESGGAIPTLAAITGLTAYSDGGSTVVQWETDSENNTIGFNLYRKDSPDGEFIRVNKDMLPGLIDSPYGGIYRFVDVNAYFGNKYTYRLEEVEFNGRRFSSNPQKVTVITKSQAFSGKEEILFQMQPMNGFYSKTHRGINPEENIRFQDRNLFLENTRALSASSDGSKVKIAVREKGVYFVSTEKIASVLGISVRNAEKKIQSGQFLLTSRGMNIAYRPHTKNRGITFFGENINSNYTAENIYTLEEGYGLLMGQMNGGMPSHANKNQTFPDVIHVEEDHLAVTGLFNDSEDDFWMWDFINPSDPEAEKKSFTFFIYDASASGEATLELNLKGATNTNHHVKVSLNGLIIGQNRWEDKDSHEVRISFDQALLNRGKNRLELIGVLDKAVPYSIFYLDSFDLKYNRYYRALTNRLLCRANGNDVITIYGFSAKGITVLDVTNPIDPVRITGTSIGMGGGGYRVSFKPASKDSSYIAFTNNGMEKPSAVTADTSSNLKGKGNKAEYIVIYPAGFKHAAKILTDYREGHGLKSKLVALEDIYDEFNFGMASPRAIQDFLSYAYSNWSTAPGYIVLAGSGTYDYKNNQGYNDNLIPVIMAATPYGLYASDNRYVDMENDGIPEMAIGRLPVITDEELREVIDKIITYESSGRSWAYKVMLLADDPDDGGNFRKTSNNMALLLSRHKPEKVYLFRGDNINKKRSEVRQKIEKGVFLVNYVGHAGITHLTLEGIFRDIEAKKLTNKDRLPVFTAMTCVAGRFAIPGMACLSETLMLNSEGGAVAVWAPTGIAFNFMHEDLDAEFFRAVFGEKERILGKAIQTAKERYALDGGETYLLDIMNLLGDPALELR